LTTSGENKALVPLGLVVEFSLMELVRRQDHHLLVRIRKRNGMEIMKMFLDEPGTEKTWDAAIEDGCLAETGDEDPQLCGWDSADGLFHCQDGIDLGMFHITLDDIGRRVPGIDVHGDNLVAVVDDTQMTVMVLVQTTFMDLAEVQDVHHPDVCWCEDHMSGPMIFGKQLLDLLTKSFKIMFDLVVFKNHFLFLMVHP
jgi:hypothetical protein